MTDTASNNLPTEKKAQRKKKYGKLDILSLYWRLGRVRYIGYIFGFSILATLLSVAANHLVTAMPVTVSGYLLPFMMVLIYGGLILITIMLTIKRCHDFDTTGWFSLLLVLPFAVLIFSLIPGTDGVNRFGRDLPPNSLAEKFLAFLAFLAILTSIGMLVKLFVSSYPG